MNQPKMKTWNIPIEARWMAELKTCDKTIEGKRNSKTWSGMKVGDRIIFESGEETLETRIFALRKYKTLERYLTIEGLGRTLPGVLTIEEGIALYHEYWAREEIERDGILAIEIEFMWETKCENTLFRLDSLVVYLFGHQDWNQKDNQNTIKSLSKRRFWEIIKEMVKKVSFW